MSNTLKPIVGVGTKLPQGTVVSISNDGVVVEKKGKKSTVGFKQVEQLLSKGTTHVYKFSTLATQGRRNFLQVSKARKTQHFEASHRHSRKS